MPAYDARAIGSIPCSDRRGVLSSCGVEGIGIKVASIGILHVFDHHRQSPFQGTNAMENAQPFVLIVEDDSSTRYILTRILGQRGLKVVAVPTIAEGLELLGAEPACVVVDLQLSDGRGEVLLDRIREEGHRGRVVICTAIRDRNRIDGLSSYQPDAIIHKPIEMRELLEACSA